MSTTLSPQALRHNIRSGKHSGNTSGFAPGFVQCNIVILPADQANDFLRFCQLNPKPCPLIAAGEPGNPTVPPLGDIDIRTDVPSYRVFRDGKLAEELPDITELWRDDLVSFALGCSFSFEEALLADGLEVRNVSEGVNVPMYRTNIDCTSAGPCAGNIVLGTNIDFYADLPERPLDHLHGCQFSRIAVDVEAQSQRQFDPGFLEQ